MKILLVLTHPRPGSFNHGIAETVINTLNDAGHQVVYRDLYEEKFDPVLPEPELTAKEEELPPEIQAAMQEVREADGLVFVHPNWWGGPPAMLRGWIDRVIRAGFAYKFSPEGAVGQFGNKAAVVFSTSNTPRDVEINVYGDPVGVFWEKVVFGLCGSKSYDRINFEPVILSTPEQRADWLAQVGALVERVFPGRH